MNATIASEPRSLTDLIVTIGRLTAEMDASIAEASARHSAMAARIARYKQDLGRASLGLDLDKIAEAETVLAVRGAFAKAGAERESARQDAIKWLAAQAGGDPCSERLNLRAEYFGTKSYDRWHGQREDHAYGYGPRHGSTIFEIGLRNDARKRDLTPAEVEAAIYYLLNLEAIQGKAAEASR